MYGSTAGIVNVAAALAIATCGATTTHACVAGRYVTSVASVPSNAAPRNVVRPLLDVTSAPRRSNAASGDQPSGSSAGSPAATAPSWNWRRARGLIGSAARPTRTDRLRTAAEKRDDQQVTAA